MTEQFDDIPRPEWHKSLSEEITVTGREYELVFEGLNLPDTYLTSGSVVLSVGEGLSGFARGLKRHYPVQAVALDPLYRNPDVVSKEPKVVKAILEEDYGTRLRYVEHQSNDPKTVPLPDAKRALAGSVYSLPFFNNSVDLIVGYGVVEHIDWLQAVPELLRVVKDSGEIRVSGVGGAWFNNSTDDNKLFGGIKHGIRANNLEAVGLLGEEVSCYVTLHRANYSGGNYTWVRHWILRKDDKLPVVTRMDGENEDMEIFKVGHQIHTANSIDEIEDPTHNTMNYLSMTRVA